MMVCCHQLVCTFLRKWQKIVMTCTQNKDDMEMSRHKMKINFIQLENGDDVYKYFNE